MAALVSRRRPLILAVLGAAVLFVSSPVWLPATGTFLIKADQPERADLAVVLAGGSSGNRILRGAELVRDGFAKKVLVSNTAGYYGHEEADMAIDFASRHGAPREIFLKTAHQSKSTEEEAQTILPVLREMNVRTFLLVTSDYHTRRAGRIFGRYLDGLRMRVIATPDPHYHPDRWWKSRESRKVFFLEWTKTLAGTLGL